MTKKLGLIALLLWAGLGAWSCDKKPTNPVLPKDEQYPAAPRDLAIAVGDQKAVLTWNIDKPNTIKFYRLYRRDSTTTVFALIDTAMGRRYVDSRLRNDVKYFYQVSAVNFDGLEGRRSAAAAAIPNFFAIAIEFGADYTAKSEVQITVTAPLRTTLMMFGNDSSFTNGAWQRYSATAQWRLADGDGKKSVYAKFRDADGKESADIVKDAIILDTTALIANVTEDSKGKILMFGNRIHFTLAANEVGGNAKIGIVGGPQGVQLFDDGTHGDKKNGDGIYEADYSIPQSVQVINGKVRGFFTDRVGNVAQFLEAATLITIQKPPDAVSLSLPTPIGAQQNALRLSWSASRDTVDFVSYTIYRSLTPNFDPALIAPLENVTVMQVTTYNDVNLQPGVTYYYRIVVFDNAGLKSLPSNEVSGRTSPNLPPAAVVLNTPIPVDDGTSKAQLTWSRSLDNDFASYRIYRANNAKVDSLSILLTSITSQGTTLYVDSGLKAATKYFYRVYVYDQAGNAAGSNIVNITTAPNLPPAPVTLAIPTAVDTASLRLSWSQNLDADFASYRLFRTTPAGPPIDPAKQQPIAIINANSANTIYTDTGLRSKTKYLYQVFVYDLGGLFAGSNQVEGTTR
jgi:fibronectin type 3 domain-containing protein